MHCADDRSKLRPCAEHATRGTPSHYALKEDSKRGFQLGLILIGGRHMDEGIKIMNASLYHFPIGNAGQDGAHAAEPSALILSGFCSRYPNLIQFASCRFDCQ